MDTFFGFLDTIPDGLDVVPSVINDLDCYALGSYIALPEQFSGYSAHFLYRSSRWSNKMRVNRRSTTNAATPPDVSTDKEVKPLDTLSELK